MFAERLAKIFIPLLVIGAMLASYSHAQAFRNTSEGQKPPDFSLKDGSGADYALSSLAGKVVVVAFIRPDQQNSVLALRDLQQIDLRYSTKGVAFLGIVSEDDQKNKAVLLVQAEKIGFPVLYDEGRKVYGAWGAFLYPMTAIIGKDGILAAQVPSHSWSYGDAVEANIRLALGEINKEQLDLALNPKAKEKESPGAVMAQRHMLLADKLAERGQSDKACAELAQAVESAPELTEARVKYGFALLKAGDPVKAQEQFQKAVELNPKSDDAKTGLGACLVAQGQLDKGLEVLGESVKQNPKPARANFELGKAYEKKGVFDKAALHYRKAAEELGNW